MRGTERTGGAWKGWERKDGGEGRRRRAHPIVQQQLKDSNNRATHKKLRERWRGEREREIVVFGGTKQRVMMEEEGGGGREDNPTNRRGDM